MLDFKQQIDWTNEKNSFMTHNFMRLSQLWEDHAVVELEVHPESCNLFGSLHGGTLFTLADCAAGAAARSKGMRYVTLSNSFEFHAASESDFISAVATVRHRGKSICTISVDVKDAQEKLLAGGTFTMYQIGPLDDAG